MKLVISTFQSYGDTRLVHRGTQFKLRYIHAPTDSAIEEKDLRQLARVVADDARELGFYVSYSLDQDEQEIRPRHQRPGHVPLSPREVALAARLNMAEQQARRLLEENRRMRFAMQSGGISCAQFDKEYKANEKAKL